MADVASWFNVITPNTARPLEAHDDHAASALLYALGHRLPRVTLWKRWQKPRFSVFLRRERTCELRIAAHFCIDPICWLTATQVTCHPQHDALARL
jgi:hypothetical protein